MVTNNLALADYDLLRWIPLIPLLAAVFNLFWGRALGRKTAGALACAAVGASFVLAFYVFWQLPSNGVFRDLVYTWIDSGSFKVNLSFQVDALSAVMLLIVTGIGFLIHIYSLGYMEHDEGMVRFFIYLNLFIFFMLVLVMGDNLLTLFVGWEGVGLCSYLLIGFWYQDPNNAIAGNKAFIVNRIGDFGFLLGIFLAGHGARPPGDLDARFPRIAKACMQMLSPHVIGVDHLVALHRRHRQIGAAPALCLAARRHGRPDAGERVDPRRHHGHRRCLYDCAAAFSFCSGAVDSSADRLDRRGHGILRGDDRADAKRY